MEPEDLLLYSQEPAIGPCSVSLLQKIILWSQNNDVIECC